MKVIGLELEDNGSSCIGISYMLVPLHFFASFYLALEYFRITGDSGLPVQYRGSIKRITRFQTEKRQWETTILIEKGEGKVENYYTL